jgi:hypothetical protein
MLDSIHPEVVVVRMDWCESSSDVVIGLRARRRGKGEREEKRGRESKRTVERHDGRFDGNGIGRGLRD